ncbi:MAG: peptide-methionine (S)-S-oxide reductase MsrA [Candidatus Thermoplasmatota archaeon]|nr:peptide-methionine (S)-S-oxide reductase MsrA [Candidatus Thermoplasmatota archaeon]MBS3790294.1 peptide-methionine (S)-S-oxide reductase MsrA [Candidatus Thermoplasmatota archaeon]
MKKTPPIDEDIPKKSKTATFSMGCFWGPDSLFGSIPEVIRTKVGYSGGDKKDPTYHSLGGHTETVQIDYDPERLSYKELLNIFWNNHDPTNPKSTQYMSIIFFHDDEQEKIARKSKERVQKGYSGNIRTDIRPYSKFYRAEDYHQKYHLSRNKKVYRAYQQIYPDMEDFVSSTAVARANGYVSGHGNLKSREDLKDLGLNEEGRKMLYRKWKSSGGEKICSLK